MTTEAPARHLTQEEIDYHTANHLRLLRPLLQRLGMGGSPVSDGYVRTELPDECFTPLGWSTVDAAIGVARTSAEHLFGMMGGPGDDELLEEASVFLTVAACTLAGMEDPHKPGMNGPWAAMGLLRMLEDFIERAEEREQASDHDATVEASKRLGVTEKVEESAHVAGAVNPQTTVMMIRDLADVVRNLAGRFLLTEDDGEVELLPTLRSGVATLARLIWSAENTNNQFPEAFQAEFHERYDDFWNLLVLVTALDRAIEYPDESPIGVGPAARNCASVAEDVAERFVSWADALEPKYDPGIRLREVAHV